MDIVTIDFETYYSKDFSLSKMTTEQYIRSPIFEVIGVAVKTNGHPSDWYSGENFHGFLNSIDYSDKAILCHNTAFDGAILDWHFGIKPKLWLDTMSMARPHHALTTGCSLKALAKHYGVGTKGTEVVNAMGKRRSDFTVGEMERYGDYSTNDADICWALWKILKKMTPTSELLLIDQVLRMFIEPSFVLDKPLLEGHLASVIRKKNALLDKIASRSETDITVQVLGGEAIKGALMSNNVLADLLRLFKVNPPMKISKSTGQPAYAFAKSDKEFKALLEHPNIHIQNIVAARLGVKSTLEESRTTSFVAAADRGPLPIMLNYYGAHTGRLSGGDGMNLQNLPRGGVLRKALKAPPGHVVITCDSSQIEARMIGYVAGQDDLTEAFANKRDVYSEFATDVYGFPITKADKVERFVGKTCILGLGYGMGKERFRETLAIGQGGISLDIDENEAARIVRLYRNKNHKIVSLWNQAGEALASMVRGETGMIGDMLYYDPSGILLPNGLRLLYPNLTAKVGGFEYDGRYGPVNIYSGKVAENFTQALARLVISDQMLAIGQRYRPRLQVHDEIVVIVREEEVDEAMAFISEAMRVAPPWAPGLPVDCEIGVGPSYGEAK